MRLLALLLILLKWSADAVGLRSSLHRPQSKSTLGRMNKPCHFNFRKTNRFGISKKIMSYSLNQLFSI